MTELELIFNDIFTPKKVLFSSENSTFWSECRDSNPGPLGPEGRFQTFSGHFMWFLTLFAPIQFIFRPLGPPGFHVFRSGVWYVLWSETRPQPLPMFFTDREGERFFASGCLYYNSDGRMEQVISTLSTAQELGGCKQRISAAAVNLDPSAYSEALGVGPVGHRQQR